MSGPSSGEYYILTRDRHESRRLDSQHCFFRELCGGKLIHKSISGEKIVSVADVAAGTGVWLRDVQSYLDTTYPSKNKRYYHGFDISDEQFPKDRGDGSIQFSLQNILEPFPSEHHGRYDLVHVRLLVAALKEPEYKQAVANIATLLKPGGHFQWEDLDHRYMLTTPEKQYQDLPSMDTLRLCIQGQIDCGGSDNAPATVVTAAQFVGLQNTTRIDYKTRDRPDLWPMTNDWTDNVFETLARIFLKKRRDAAAAADEGELWRNDYNIEEEVKRRVQDLKDGHEKGFVMHANVGMVVAKKL
ncbi:hypothetical protein TMatcc_003278 [Talaromyces marneffei ATCC 18224]|uniref:LaeA-like methyltransferase, putative n=2 Tax=Talaromyces marneffei TaxID=37727 RepID=B6Q572_TALMQ|nr:LaeA-like methyltransferase, putative [Talaromyces marneffei ATCC 18224]KAE8555977.1 hypothetical protein EYB25_000676 [Talaromyces marneffei]